ncbi:MAG: prepilin-type N-terminal cleavage/methylation domain-containing protein [Deltaproteobacteria bacterium]|nr:prepilin-type N-terminal cleavage/methylation domain-containing protein [Deltaproteobacteria bacterium]
MISSQTIASSRGFTLLELLVVMAIVVILTGIAVPQFSAYRQRAFDLRALSDLRNLAAAEEVYFMDSESYLTCSNQECLNLPGIAALSRGVSISAQAAERSFTATASHDKGSGRSFEWDSDNGGLQE